MKTIASIADCSAEGARTARREYAEKGVVVQTNENPKTYERNPRYFQFLRGHALPKRTPPRNYRNNASKRTTSTERSLRSLGEGSLSRLERGEGVPCYSVAVAHNPKSGIYTRPKKLYSAPYTVVHEGSI